MGNWNGTVIDGLEPEWTWGREHAELRIVAGHFFVQFSTMTTQNWIMIVLNCTDGQSNFSLASQTQSLIFSSDSSYGEEMGWNWNGPGVRTWEQLWRIEVGK